MVRFVQQILDLIFDLMEEKMSVNGRIVVSDEYCKGCELCIFACPKQVIAVDIEHITVKGYHPARMVTDGCTGCAICAVVCPEAAITVFRFIKKPSESDQ